LVELVPRAAKARVDVIRHSVIRIGRFDRKLGGLVNLEDSDEFIRVNPSDEFSGLPTGIGFSHPLQSDDFEIRNRKFEGVEFEFKPKRLGIYLINCTWWLEEARISGAPVVLVVKPPTDKDGKPILKPEWLGEDK
jgi:hypothetical protein